MPGRRLCIEGRNRDRRDARLVDDRIAKRHVVHCHAGCCQVHRDEIGRRRGYGHQTEALQPVAEKVARCLVLGARHRDPVVLAGQPLRHRPLQVGRGGEGEELVRLGEDAGKRRGGAHPPYLPPGEPEDLARRADLHRPLAHARILHQRPVLRAIIDQGLPHLVADRDQVMLGADPRQQRQVIGMRAGPHRVHRIVEHQCTGARRDRRGERLRIDPPARRVEGDEPRDAACALHQRQIGVVQRLEQQHLVARADHRQQGRRNRLGRAGGHHDLVGAKLQLLVTPVPIRHRAAQLGDADHRRILVRPLLQRVARRIDDRIVAWPVGKALSQVDRACRPCAHRHRLEDRGGHVAVDRVHVSS